MLKSALISLFCLGQIVGCSKSETSGEDSPSSEQTSQAALKPTTTAIPHIPSLESLGSHLEALAPLDCIAEGRNNIKNVSEWLKSNQPTKGPHTIDSLNDLKTQLSKLSIVTPKEGSGVDMTLDEFKAATHDLSSAIIRMTDAATNNQTDILVKTQKQLNNGIQNFVAAKNRLVDECSDE